MLVVSARAQTLDVSGGVLGQLATAVLRKTGVRAEYRDLNCGKLPEDHPDCLRRRLEPALTTDLKQFRVNLLVGQPVLPDTDLSTDGMYYLGNVAPATRRHCSVPSTTSPSASPNATLEDLADEEFAARYHLPTHLLRPHLIAKNGKLVKDGIFRPEWCEEKEKCATILAEEVPEARLIAELVLREKWRALVVVVRDLSATWQLGASVVCTSPVSPTRVGRVALVAPPCRTVDHFCPFESRRLTKLSTTPLPIVDRRASAIMTRFRLTAPQYHELKQLSVTEGDERAVEIWLERHDATFRSWIAPIGHQVRVVTALPRSADADMSAAARLAERDAADVAGLMFKVETRNVGCSPYGLEKIVSDAIASDAAAVVVPDCGASAAAARAAPYGLAVVVAGMAADTLPEATVLRAGGERAALGSALWATMAVLDWTRVTVLTEGEAAGAARTMRARVVHAVHLSALYSTPDYDTVRQWATESARADARLVVLCAENAALAYAARRAAREIGWEAVWLSAGMAEVVAEEGDLMVAPSWKKPELQPLTDALDVMWTTRHSRMCVPPCAALPSVAAALLYDSLTVTFRALACVLRQKSVDELRSKAALVSLTKCVLRVNVSGVTGSFLFREDLVRRVDIDVYQWRNGSYKSVGTWSDNEGLELSPERLVWPHGDVPTDGTTCEWLRGECGRGAAAGAGLLLLLAVMLAAMYVRAKRRAERLCARRLQEAAAAGRGDPAAPDSWELPRERVVINRRLGTGAFGAVYGGHALLDGVWTAVAVKTLRAGATVDQKLEFLSEAESMKRLRHENVVRLLGVVTASEPACLVLALAALGDLRGFLLARRGHGAGVSVRRLGRWALQAARALAYLRRQRLVHRDVAARNCLLSAGRTLRLADFGMARPCGDGDYYRFGRKGMLPIRWMAPESVCLGVFSPASDVWSFGVLLYEIVTFGALPFQGFSNSEVLEQVKEGRTVPLPPGLKPQLEGLMRSCWRRAREARPPSSEIAAFLADHPRLLTPCLGPPPSLSFSSPPGQFPSEQYSLGQCTESQCPLPEKSACTDLTELSEATDADPFLDNDSAEYDLFDFVSEKLQ